MWVWINLCSDVLYCKIKIDILFRMRIGLEYLSICYVIYNVNIVIYIFMLRLGLNVDI